MKLRPYQEEAVESIFDYYREGGTGNPLVVLPTGSGKSLVQASFIRRVLERWPSQRFVLLTHVKELVEQNGAELVRAWPDSQWRIGYYNAAMRRRDIGCQITLASIQSVYRRALEFGHVDLILIDEAHLVPPKGEGMYRQFLSELRAVCPAVKVVGLTATPYRLGTGMLHQGEGAIFTDICYSADVKGLIRDGYLAPLTTRLAKDRADLSGVRVRGGEYVAGELEAVMSADDVVRGAVSETVQLASGRRKWLVFCAGVDHAIKVRDEFRRHGVTAETITGNTDRAEREDLVERFKRGEFRALTNVNVLTTGFNVPDIDCLVMLRPTKSTSLYVQILGRGMRNAPGKDDCLVLDFCGNILEHGPIDQITIKRSQGGKDEVGLAPQKVCDACDEFVPISARLCPFCGHEFETDDLPKHDSRAQLGVNVLTPDEPEWRLVEDVVYRRHTKPGKPDSLRVDYVSHLFSVSEWVCLEHDGYARRRAEEWWARRSTTPPPNSVKEALDAQTSIAKPSKILVDESSKYPKILRFEF